MLHLAALGAAPWSTTPSLSLPHLGAGAPAAQPVAHVWRICVQLFSSPNKLMTELRKTATLQFNVAVHGKS